MIHLPADELTAAEVALAGARQHLDAVNERIARGFEGRSARFRAEYAINTALVRWDAATAEHAQYELEQSLPAAARAA